MPEFGPVDLKLLHDRQDAIARDDKALGREIYHQLQEHGWQGHEIDGWNPDAESAPVLPEGPVEVIKPDDAPVETADAAAAPERAVRHNRKKVN